MYEITITIAQAAGHVLKLELAPDPDCPNCGRPPVSLEAHYKALGEAAAEALFAGTPGGFWGAITNYVIDQALRSGKVERPPCGR